MPFMNWIGMTALKISQPKDCRELPPEHLVFGITPVNGSTISVFCEMDTGNGGWTTIQRRYDGTVDFYRFWDDYKAGFGEIAGEHWLGNDYLHAILRQRSYQVRFEVEDFSGNTAYAIYSAMYVGDESTNYKLSLTGYKGTAGNAMVDANGTPMNGMMFTTLDGDNDISRDNCGNIKKSGWWHAACTWANLNGGMYIDEINEKSIHWKTWKENGLKGTRIMIKPQPSF
ncbi:Ryncolin-2,Techylectin-5B,Angiopoietin-1,Angiopoietin-2,Ficolin-2,Ficolin-1,Ryncolin-3,Angiopoietin-related protein 7,Angiopoietin-4 [Mytilus edulis]|uniref:Ryncolin-2,Techylectin-5B,Angiopoietin-1,Angiopoi etin-2,Ficolin-2,Ficolin-1,Ryncolin-3,Angiopoietin-related protein 7,Angiopoietin-4 n=1 Tax=Mytilus edulis TaxID=6550 RepID=A0A8S3S669_MYTED|nr:Ryncolin-2,Techylectin-5B,Angiopoietin-1,Angiopoietin-2,Ficolin-2,Ficolin-1,Ryncolin-3,Angiopoietin-related protein 7,Angiopoietin-4 [Mytilus edulis]